MRKIRTSIALIIVLCLAGCHIAAPTPATAPTGAVDSIDAAANLTLQPAHAFALSVTTSVQSGKLQLTQAQLNALNALNGALNVADAAEIAYHNAGGGNASTLNATVAAVNSALSNALAVFNSITK